MSLITRSGGAAVDRRERLARRAATSSRPGPSPRPRGTLSASFMKRLAVLPQRDRAIIELTLRANLSRAGIARALGITPGQVTRRLRILYARLHDPLVVALFDARCPLTPEYRQLGTEHFLLGSSPRELADKHRLSVHDVRRTLVFLRGWHKGAASR